MYKITYFGYDIYELQYDLGSGKLLKTKSDIQLHKKHNQFNDKFDALKYICEFLGTEYKEGDWCFEEGFGDEDDMWVLHIMVDKDNKWATEEMISKFRNDELELFDLLVNVKIELKEEK